MFSSRFRYLGYNGSFLIVDFVFFQEIADKEIADLPRDSTRFRLVDRCAITSRPRGVQQRWRVSRIIWRHLADYNKLSGVTRAWW